MRPTSGGVAFAIDQEMGTSISATKPSPSVSKATAQHEPEQTSRPKKHPSPAKKNPPNPTAPNPAPAKADPKPLATPEPKRERNVETIRGDMNKNFQEMTKALDGAKDAYQARYSLAKGWIKHVGLYDEYVP